MFPFYHLRFLSVFLLTITISTYNPALSFSPHNISRVGVRICDIITAFLSRRVRVRRAEAIFMYTRSNNMTLVSLNKEVHETRTCIFEVYHTNTIRSNSPELQSYRSKTQLFDKIYEGLSSTVCANETQRKGALHHIN